MSELCLLAAVSLATGQSGAIQSSAIQPGAIPSSAVQSSASASSADSNRRTVPSTRHRTDSPGHSLNTPCPETAPTPASFDSPPHPEFSSPTPISHPPNHPTTHSPIHPSTHPPIYPSTHPPTKPLRPSSGRQFFQQRRTALQSGQSYTRIAADSFADRWLQTTYDPSYEDWLGLLSHEAQAMAVGQGNNRLTVMVGDSISLWFPTEYMPRHRFWLNQSISGDTAAGTLGRLSFFEKTNPDIIHLMIGINDLRRGISDQHLLSLQQQIIRRLRQQHPHAQIIVHSLLPTRLPSIPGDRLRHINNQLGAIAHQEGAQLLDLHRYFIDDTGQLNPTLTTDGLHLNGAGYALWYSILQQMPLT